MVVSDAFKQLFFIVEFEEAWKNKSGGLLL